MTRTYKSMMLWAMTFATLSSTAQVDQVLWSNNFQEAKVRAISEQKFILMDFWAVWCGPCRTMDNDLWNTEAFKAIADKVIPVKIDVDYNRELAIRFTASAIPKVVLLSPNGDIIWDQVGFRSANPYLRILRDIPLMGEEFTELQVRHLKSEKDEMVQAKLSEAYQELARTQENSTLKMAFIRHSNGYARKVAKQTDDQKLISKMEIVNILNDAYLGSVKKVRKKMGKLSDKGFDEELTEMKNFIAAFCFKCEGKKEEMEELKLGISNEKYLAQLEE